MTTQTVLENIIPRPTAESKLHLYLAWGCPFCHRVLAALKIAGFSECISFTLMCNIKGPAGWEIAADDDPLYGALSLKDVYQRLEPGAGHTPSVPLLVDLSTRTLLSKSSSDITRFFCKGMNGAYPVKREMVPTHLVEQVDGMNTWLDKNINQAVYQVSFATTQADYETKVARLFQSLDEAEARLKMQPFLLGSALTESDLYFLATLVRFDSVYYPLFKCSYRRIAEYPALCDYLSRLQSLNALADTYNHVLIKEHYFCSVMHVGGEIRDLNPSHIVPVDPFTDKRSVGESGFRPRATCSNIA